MEIEVKIDPTCKSLRLIVVAQTMNEEVSNLLLKLNDSGTDFISGICSEGIQLIEQNEIVRIYTEDNKVIAKTKKGEFTLKIRLYECENKLDTKSFVRISNSEIINLKEVQNFDLSYSGTIFVKLKNGDSTYVSRRYVSKIKKVLGV
ncbi:LytTR family DNA-binding domain-containing protein [Anaerorhabdus furcosa]|uniref:Transcriptional regulator, LytTR family n=1 Tax=Anaerorhabdus furcosa TaxID=118967 RepID=A0A1T4KA03_9FIRM|nr:LytTR family DNA-binding domain-containing protein [Anaerorhabdus furcosa]SJZ39284.1 transcriptional regulator, LytTR family [Anaerorhabdus furcosa]